MVRGFLILENIIGLVIKHDDKVMLAKTYLPVQTGLTKLCADIKSAGNEAEWTLTFSEDIVDDQKCIVHSIVQDKEVGISQRDFDVIKFVLKECGIYEKMKLVPMLDLLASNFNSTVCLYSLCNSIIAAIVDNGSLQVIDKVPFSNYNLYLSKMANSYQFDSIVNVDNYSDYDGECSECEAHLYTIVEWMESANLIYLSQYEHADLTALDEDEKMVQHELEDDNLSQYEDEEVISVPKRPTRPSRPSRNKMDARAKVSEEFMSEEQLEEELLGQRPVRTERPKRPVTAERPKRPVTAERPTRSNDDQRVRRSEREVNTQRPVRNERPSREHRPTRRAASVDRTSRNSLDDDGYHVKGTKDKKAVTKKSNTLLVLLFLLALIGGTFDGCNRYIMNIFSAKSAETVTSLDAAIEEAQSDIETFNKINAQIESFQTTADRI